VLPFDRVAAQAPVRPVDKRELLLRVRDLEARALSSRTTCAVACLQDVRFLTPWTRDVYRTLAARGATVIMYGRGLRSYVEEGVRGIDLDDDDPLVDQWAVVFEGDDPVCLAARDLLGPDTVEERAFEYAVTRDAAVVREVAASLGIGTA
jgi:hypothetical protein